MVQEPLHASTVNMCKIETADHLAAFKGLHQGLAPIMGGNVYSCADNISSSQKVCQQLDMHCLISSGVLPTREQSTFHYIGWTQGLKLVADFPASCYNLEPTPLQLLGDLWL